MDIVRARWSSVSFLLYAGALVVLLTAVFLLGALSDEYGSAALFGWSALVLAIVVVMMLGITVAGHRLLAGLFAFISVGVFAVFVGSFLNWIGILDDEPFEGFSVGLLLLYLAVLVASLVLLARFHFPLLVLAAAGAGWLFVVDLISNGGDWTAVVAIFVGLFFLVAGLVADRWYGFWLHVVAGLSIGGGFLVLWHSAHWEWVLIGIVSLVFFAFATSLERSSYAVLGAAGLLLMWTHFVEDWLGDSFLASIFGGEDLGHDVARVLLYALYGAALVVIGLVLEQRRREPLFVDESPAAP
jgi:hypothetical protein